MTNTQQDFIDVLKTSLHKQLWVKLLLSKYSGDEPDLKKIIVRPITVKGELSLSFVYSYKTQDITKNFSPDAGFLQIFELLGTSFKSAHLFESGTETQLDISKKGKVIVRHHAALTAVTSTQQHDNSKKRFVDIQRPYLSALGITDHNKKLIPSMSAKWKQINKFIEIFESALGSIALDPKAPLQIIDFGSGKGYLTFSLHDYLHCTRGNLAQVTGVELRENLTILCNTTAAQLGHNNLSFVCGDVKSHTPKYCDVMIALHACDTATDHAIHYGIKANAQIIMCSPCCHKEIRPQLKSPLLLQPMLKHGIHASQEAEMITDSLRALLLEAHGYSTKIFEFISLEHTPKNKMILATKNSSTKQKKQKQTEALEQIKAIKEFYGIQEHCLENLLEQQL